MFALTISGLCQLVILFSLSVEFSTVSCDTFYIVTSPSSPCPGEYIGVPCLTLQQYASNPSRSQNITFLIDPGMYNLSAILTVSDGYNFTMSSRDVIVTCTSATAKFEFNGVENVHISGMTFQGCTNGAVVQMSRVTKAIVRKSNFIRNQVNCLQASNSAVTVIESNFYNNGGYSSDLLVKSAINVFSSKVLIKYSQFNNNTASWGGAINAWYSNLTIYGSEFSYNYVRGNGGAIYVDSPLSGIQIDHTIFYGNRAGNGGACAVSVSAYDGIFHFQMKNTIINFNRANYQGGAVYVNSYFNEGFFEMTFHNITAYSNIASQSDGGAIYIYVKVYGRNVNKPLSITESQFISNTARQGNGGAIALYEATNRANNNTSVFTKCQFSNNVAQNANGGAIYKTGENAKLVINQNSYAGNIAGTFGGAIYVGGENNSIHVSSTTFINNTATTEGGGAIHSNGRYANVTLTWSVFHNNSASYCGVLNVDSYTHYSINLTNSIFSYNTASGQTIGGGVACIRNAAINIIDSTFRHNFANHHAGVFYIDESHTTVDGSLFINNSAALDGGVFYTYVHASDYIIRRSQFSENMAGENGGVMLIGRLNCHVSIDENIFDFNSAGDRGGVVAIIASSLYMEVNRTNIFNNMAQFGGVISSCNSQVTLVGDGLFVTVDPVLPFCKLYDGNVRQFNITAPPEAVVTTEPIATIEPQTITEEFPMSLNPTSDQTNMVTRATTSMAFWITHSDIVTTAPDPLSEGNKYTPAVAREEVDKKMTIIIALSATSLIVSLIAILMSMMMTALIWKKGSLRKTISKMKGLSVNPSRTFSKLEHTSPIYNSNSSEDEDDADAL